MIDFRQMLKKKKKKKKKQKKKKKEDLEFAPVKIQNQELVFVKNNYDLEKAKMNCNVIFDYCS